MRTILILSAVGVLLVAFASWIGSRRQDRSNALMVEELLASAASDASRVSFTALEGLPAPVAGYLRHVLRTGQPMIRLARLTQRGQLRIVPESSRWLSFSATQAAVPTAHAFVWDASVAIAPLLHVRVMDAYAHGRGSGRVSLLSFIPAGADSAKPELDSGALLRYLAEAVWYPTALLPSPALRWTAIDSSKALATFTDQGISVALEFWFNRDGEVTGVYSPGRWGKFKGEYRQARWEGHFRNYQERAGMLVPGEGEVGWYVDERWERVWSGTIVRSSYEFWRSP